MLGEGADYSDLGPSLDVRHPSFRRLGPRLGVLHVAFHGVVADVEHPEGRHAVWPRLRAPSGSHKERIATQNARSGSRRAISLVCALRVGLSVMRRVVGAVRTYARRWYFTSNCLLSALRGKDEQMSEQNCTYRHVYSAPRGVLYDATYLN